MTCKHNTPKDAICFKCKRDENPLYVSSPYVAAYDCFGDRIDFDSMSVGSIYIDTPTNDGWEKTYNGWKRVDDFTRLAFPRVPPKDSNHILY